MSGIMRLGFVEYQVPDLVLASNFYEQVFGLIKVAETPERLYYKCWDEYDHHSVVMKKAADLGLIKIGWKVEEESDLSRLEKKIQDYGIETRRVPGGEELEIGEAVSFVAPSGQTMWLYHKMTQVGKAVIPPEIVPHDLPGIGPTHLDHMVIAAEDLGEMVKFLTTVLGFRISEQVLDPEGRPIFSFLFLRSKPHDLALTTGPKGKFHHVAFYVDDSDAVIRAHAIIKGAQHRVDVPPSKHGITRGATTYFYDPFGNRLETFAGGYLTYPDFPTITWTVEHLSAGIFNTGGPPNLEKFMAWI
jgi:catechol 2,3-dioxygenase